VFNKVLLKLARADRAGKAQSYLFGFWQAAKDD
jgi:hypothetical protein